MTPMIAAVPPINTLSLETDPRRPASCWLGLLVSLSDIVPPSSPCLSPLYSATLLFRRFGHDIPLSPSLAAITPPGCPGLRSRPLAETLLLILPMLECRAQAGTEQCGQLPHPSNKLPKQQVCLRRYHPGGYPCLPTSTPKMLITLLPVEALRIPSSAYTPSQASAARAEGMSLAVFWSMPSSMLLAEASVGSEDAVPKPGSHYHG